MVRLLKNRLYPTFQLYAVMESKKTAPGDGLRLGALVVTDWLRQRLGGAVPEELRDLPCADDYKAVSDDQLPSLHLSRGFVIDIVSLPEQGIWCLQLVEPDLGSDPGKEDQARQAVPGRVIETNIGFRVNGGRLECGFQTVISDPEGTAREADVYRLTVVRRLILHPDFGLRQIVPLRHEGERVSTVEQMKNLCQLWRDRENHLPCVVFTHARDSASKPAFPSKPAPVGAPLLDQGPKLLIGPGGQVKPPPIAARVAELPYDADTFARKTVALCRTYAVEDKLTEKLAEAVRAAVEPGDIVVLEPKRFGGQARVLPYKPSPSRKRETMDGLLKDMYAYPRGKDVPYGNVKFIAAAREALLLSTTDALRQSEGLSLEWEQKLLERDAQWRQALAKKNEELQAARQQLDRQWAYQEQRELELERARGDAAAEVERWKLLAEKEREITACLRRKLDQPEEQGGIAAWVEKYFSGRLVLHPRAVSLLEDKSARTVDVGLICDALDFLATDYWARRYEQITTEEMNTRCGEKYGRPSR